MQFSSCSAMEQTQNPRVGETEADTRTDEPLPENLNDELIGELLDDVGATLLQFHATFTAKQTLD